MGTHVGRGRAGALKVQGARGGGANRHLDRFGVVDPTDTCQRLARIALVKPEKAQALENMLLQAAQRGQLGGKVTEDALIGMLEKINGGSGEGGGRGGPKIEMRRRNVMDDDDW